MINRVVILTVSVRIEKEIPADYIEGRGGNLANYLYRRPISWFYKIVDSEISNSLDTFFIRFILQNNV